MSEAIQGVDASKWEAAMQEEYESLMAKGTWELVALLKDRKSVGCKWVFCIGNAQIKEGSATKQVQIHKHIKCK